MESVARGVYLAGYDEVAQPDSTRGYSFVDSAFGDEGDPGDELSNTGQIVDHADDLASARNSSAGIAVHELFPTEQRTVRRRPHLCEYAVTVSGALFGTHPVNAIGRERRRNCAIVQG